tara:strand:+ start:543 stop:713 length:171 start_codon:yes stop_codon:yes gene_type:complete
LPDHTQRWRSFINIKMDRALAAQRTGGKLKFDFLNLLIVLLLYNLVYWTIVIANEL